MRIACLPFIAVCLLANTLISVGAQDSFRVGSWNLEALGTTHRRGFPERPYQIPPRTDEQLALIANEIQEIRADALMVSEIDADHPDSTDSRPQSIQLNEICDNLGEEWSYFLGRSGDDKRLGLLFNTDRLELMRLVNLDAREFHVSGKDVYDRDPFIAWMRLKAEGRIGSDLLLVGLHLKSSQETYLHNRMAAVAKLLGDLTNNDVREALGLPSKGDEPHIVILGDCNDSSFRYAPFRYMFDYLEGMGYQHLRPEENYPPTRTNGSMIDHIFASESAADELVINGSFRSHTVPEGERRRYREDLSDHFPVTVDLRNPEDSDRSFSELLAVNDFDERIRLLAAYRDDRGELSEVLEESTGPVIAEGFVKLGGFEGILAPARGRVATEWIHVAPSKPLSDHFMAPDIERVSDTLSIIDTESSGLLKPGTELTPESVDRIGILRNAERAILTEGTR